MQTAYMDICLFTAMVHPYATAVQEGANVCSDFRFEDVCKPGNTLLWDLVQENTAVCMT